jgi:hypothetical protein
MAKARVGVGLVVGCLLLGGAAPAWAAPTVAQMLAYRPKQEGIAISTPAPSEYARCKVELVTGKLPGSSGWLLRDPGGLPLRRFYDSHGDKKIDMWSYYKDGKEVYREIDTNNDGRADQYRWLNTAGMKWGVDANQDGKIDGWKAISAQEAAQEAYQALVGRDYARLQALFINDAEMQALGLPAKRAEDIRKRLQQAQAKFEDTATKLAAFGGTQPVQVEAAVPQCVPADAAGTTRDLFQLPSRGVLFEYGPEKEKKQEWVQTGELIQVGMAWRLTEAPYLGNVVSGTGATTENVVVTNNPEVQKLMERLSDLDKTVPQFPDTPQPSPEVVRYSLQRAEILEQLVKADTAKAADWMKQCADNLSTAAQYAPAADKTGLQRLQQLRDQAVRDAPGSELAGYLTYRALWTEYNRKLMEDPRVQAEWLEKLAGFVQSYPKADDTPGALMDMALGYEFAGKDDEARRCYKQVATTFADKAIARKAEGAARRLDLVGKDLELSGATASGAAFDMASLKGKVVAVYYWASYGKTRADDFARLKQVREKLGSKGFEVVTVNLDDQPGLAAGALQEAGLPGSHLVQPGADGGPNSGLNSPLATQYGIMGVPSLFLVGKDGKVISRNLPMGGLEEAVQKAL